VIFIAISRMPITTGKLNTAIRILLLLAFEEIPEMRLKAEANAMEVSRTVTTNNTKSVIGLERNMVNKPYATIDKIKHKPVL
jgi:hypothetical protein